MVRDLRWGIRRTGVARFPPGSVIRDTDGVAQTDAVYIRMSEWRMNSCRSFGGMPATPSMVFADCRRAWKSA